MAYNQYMALHPPLREDLERATLYVEGIPLDATEREVSHVFRPFAGFRRLRLITKESSRYPGTHYCICFVEFETLYQATFAKTVLKGYPFDPEKSGEGLLLSIPEADPMPAPALAPAPRLPEAPRAAPEAKRSRDEAEDEGRKRRRDR